MTKPTTTHPGLLARNVQGTLVVRNDGVHWAPVFWDLVRSVCEQLLPDGPVTATVGHLSDPDDEVVVSGSLVSCDGDELHFADGYRVPVCSVLVVAV